MVTTGDHIEGEDVIITFEEEGKDKVYNYEARITSFNTTGGTGEVETIKLFGGKSITLQKPGSDFEVKFDFVTRDTTFAQMQFGGGTLGLPGKTQITSANAGNGPRWRIIFWFIGGNNAGTASSGAIVVPLRKGELMRYIYKDCYVTARDEEMNAEEVLKGSISFKFGAVDEAGKANKYEQWTSNMGTSALTTLTTSHGGVLTWSTTAKTWSGSYRT